MKNKPFNKTEIIILIAIAIALPFVFKPDLMNETLESVFKFVVLTVLIIYIAVEAWGYFKNK